MELVSKQYLCFLLHRFIFAAMLAGLLTVFNPVYAETSQTNSVRASICPVITVYVREGCPHCTRAKAYLQELQRQIPALTIHYHDVIVDSSAGIRLQTLSAENNIERPGVPAFEICGAFRVGFAEEIGTHQWIEAQVLGKEEGLSSYRVNTPFGSYSLQELGLPLFTLLLGLIDGFNPCAMWVLLFLLSILVNIRDRRRILIIAGTFVLVSGIVYFLFMAAWLNVFLLIGFSRWLQILLGLLAIAMATIHLKDFFALGRGISLSIPNSVKPTLYARVRNIMQAKSLISALVAVTIVALMVNVVELLCTAGLPALYTQVLTLYPLSMLQYYGYLLLYNLAYLLDDGLMVAIAVTTLSQQKLQQNEGRWLKLISGLVVLILGLFLLFMPEHLF